jgi:hypothetical protein
MADRWVKSGLTPGWGPYVDWHLGPGEPYYRVPAGALGEWSPVILQLAAAGPEDIVKQANKQARALGFRTPVLRQPVLGGGAGGYAVFLARDEFFKTLADRKSGDLRKAIPRVVLGRFLAAGTRAARASLAPPNVKTAAPAEGTVVVGVIDDAIAFAQERFRNAAGKTRVEYAWVQDGLPTPKGGGVDYGRDYSKREIDKLLSEATFAGAIDEDAFYRLAGMADFARPGQGAVAHRAAHGTHVMDLACGEDPRSVGENDDKQPIVSVQLPALAAADTSGASLEPYVLHAIDYILDRADRIAEARGCGRLPVVINFSYGFIAGPHNGTSVIEAAIDAIVAQRRDAGQDVRVVIPAGNSNLTRCHALVGFEETGATQDLHWQMMPDDRTSSFMEIWLPQRPAGQKGSRLSITVTPPGGPESPPLEESSGAGFAFKQDGDILCKLVYREEPEPAGRGRFFIAALPTADPKPLTRLAPSGVWTIRLKNQALGKEETVRAWIQRDDTLYDRGRRGRQSYFDERCYRRYDQQGWVIADDALQPPCVVKRAGLLNALATGRETIVIGGFRRKETTLADYSAAGTQTPDPTLSPPYRNLDAVAVSDDSRIFRGVLAAGSRSGSVIAMSGTSFSAPQVARWLAKELAEGRSGDAAAVQAKARHDNAQMPPLPSESRHRAGEGRLALPKTRPLSRYTD